MLPHVASIQQCSSKIFELPYFDEPACQKISLMAHSKSPVIDYRLINQLSHSSFFDFQFIPGLSQSLIEFTVLKWQINSGTFLSDSHLHQTLIKLPFEPGLGNYQSQKSSIAFQLSHPQTDRRSYGRQQTWPCLRSS